MAGRNQRAEKIQYDCLKQQQEKEFLQWAADKKEYNSLLNQYKELYQKRKDLILAASYLNEAGKRGAEIVGWAADIYKKLNVSAEKLEEAKEQLKAGAEEFYKDYDAATDQKILVEMLRLYNQNLTPDWIPEEVQLANRKKGIEAYVQTLFSKSILADQENTMKLIAQATPDTYKKLEKDPAYRLSLSMNTFYAQNIFPELAKIEKEITRLNQIWLAGLMEMQPDKTFYADANSTLRVAYGKVQGYSPCDAVYYKHYTTLNGIMEKDNPEIYDYNVPQRLREIYQNQDFGNYTQNGEIPVCFIATNHTTGGNSGSPVLNAEGHLIGLNFDRAWDGVMSDMQYDAEICRNISVDIRYVLFIIDKLAGASHLIDEMVIVTD